MRPLTMLIACRDCAAIQRMPPPPARGRLECWRCGRVLESTSGRSLDAALACALATLLLLLPANLMPLMTVHVAGITASTHLGLGPAHRVAARLAAAGDRARPARRGPAVRSLRLARATLAAIRFGARGGWVGPAFRYCEKLDLWAMADVFLIGAGIGYGRVVSQIPVQIDMGGWCFVAAALMTMVTRASLERRAVWRRLEAPPADAGAGAIACTSCDLVLPPAAEGPRCPRCAGPGPPPPPVRPDPMHGAGAGGLDADADRLRVSDERDLEGGHANPHTIIDGVMLLFEHGFWTFGVIILVVSVIFPFTKLISLTWFIRSVHRRSASQLRRKTWLYRFIDEGGRWSNLDPFTVLIFAPMVQFAQVAHINIMGGSPAFLATVVLSMIAGRVLDPRLMWDAAEAGAKAGRLIRQT